jgi:hypothetical protein
MDLEDLICDLLNRNHGVWFSCKDIIKNLGMDVRKNKKKINSTLYGNEGILFHREDGVPPLWTTISNDNDIFYNIGDNNNTIKDEDKTIVFIDVDNSPCLEKAAPYAKEEVFIEAYASPAYNNFKPSNTTNLYFEHLDSGDNLPSAADVLFGMSMTSHCIHSNDPAKLFFIVVSKDKLLKTQAYMHKKKYGCDYVVVEKGWEELRDYLE